MRKLLSVLVLLMAAANAEAKSITFTFDVFSSGNDIYACNAGLSHGPAAGACYIDGNPANPSCNPSACIPNQPCNCICTGNNGGSYLVDFIAATSKPYGSTAAAAPVTLGYWSAGNNPTFQLFADNSSGAPTNSWGNQIESLSFDLGSEMYGASYFVDICYRAPQIDYFLNNVYSQNALTSSVTVTDLNMTGSGLSYAQLAGLDVTTTVSCDLQGMGKNQYAANASGAYDTDVNDTDIVNLSSGDFSLSSAPVALSSGSTATLFNNTFINGGASSIPGLNAPRFCKVRYNFTENNSKQFRKWQLQDAQVCTYTSIEESIANMLK